TRVRIILWNLTFAVKTVSFPSIFFFQAEDGIRDGHVTGVQTCALPIFFRANKAIGGCDIALYVLPMTGRRLPEIVAYGEYYSTRGVPAIIVAYAPEGNGWKCILNLESEQRSEERRVGKECR